MSDAGFGCGKQSTMIISELDHQRTGRVAIGWHLSACLAISSPR
jgi:hypothetical protein